MNKRLALLALLPLFGACVNRGYNAEPVVGPNDHRVVDVPNLSDEDLIKDTNCWRIVLWANGWSEDERNVGIACLVEDEADR